MFDKVTITYRGARYEIGRGRDFYGIWAVGGSRSQPLQWWPETSDGWSAAWTRFTEMEVPSTIAAVGRRTPPVARISSPAGESPAAVGTSTLTRDEGMARPVSVRSGAIGAAALLAAGVILGIAGLFLSYLGGTSLAQQGAEVVPHAIYLAAWTASAVLILLGGVRLRWGALLGVGMSAVTFGLFFADAGTVIATGAKLGGAGLWLSLAGWVACAAGSVTALTIRPGRSARRGFPARPRGAELGPVVLLVLAGLGVAAAFAPSWDSYTLRTATGQSQSLTAGNAFANPGVVIAGNVAVMVALAAVVIVAALWRPVRHGAVLLAGAAIPMAAQGISALILVGGSASPAQFGFTPAQATQLGLTIRSGVTPAFWIYCGFLVALVVSCAWMLFAPHEARRYGPGLSARADSHGWNPAVPVAVEPTMREPQTMPEPELSGTTPAAESPDSKD